MNQELFLRELLALPDEAQRQVLDFIGFLRSRYPQPDSSEIHTTTDLRQEPFIGMWAGREDMVDSRAWVRNLRIQEWR